METETNKQPSAKIVDSIFQQNENFIIVGLTGRVHSGQDEVVNILTNHKFQKLKGLYAMGGQYKSDLERENNLILRYFDRNWRPFIKIHTPSVMMSFLLEEFEEFKDFETSSKFKDLPKSKQEILEKFGIACTKINTKELNEMFDEFSENLFYMLIDTKKENIGWCRDELKNFKSNLKKEFDSLLDKFEDTGNTDFGSDTVGCDKEFDIKKMAKFWNKSYKDPIKKNALNKDSFKDPQLLLFCFIILPYIRKAFKTLIDRDYISTLQEIGIRLRAYGNFFEETSEEMGEIIKGNHIFSISDRINNIIKILRNSTLEYSDEIKKKLDKYDDNKAMTLVLIDDFKNFHEAYYFRKRYSSFYLMSVSMDEESRRKNSTLSEDKFVLSSLNETTNSGKKIYEKFENKLKNIISQDIEKDIDVMKIVAKDNDPDIEYTYDDNKDDNKDEVKITKEQFKKLKQEFKNEGGSDTEFDFCKLAFNDQLRRFCYHKGLHTFILQDIIPCIENADIFINNSYPKDINRYHLELDVMRYATLMRHPALLTPTPIERCMQMAMASKLNSGCLSRQVGAVVTDQDFNILSLGWNDSPCGTVSCIRRNFFDLKQKYDHTAYSEFELTNKDFREHVDNWNDMEMSELQGLPGAFCFKDVYGEVSGKRDQIHARSLHAEERALAVCGTNAKNGFIFTTSSPCELCAKKAKDAGIERIYYIEQFTGISNSHVIQVGEQRAEYTFFSGATGSAYTKLYTPIMPYKDELSARGFKPNKRHNKEEK